MADGSVVIGVELDTSAFAASASSLEFQIRELGAMINATMAQSFAAEGISASLAAAMAGVTESVTMMAQNIALAMQTAAVTAIESFTGAGWDAAGSQAAAAISSGMASGGGAVTSAVSSIAAQASAAFQSVGWSSIGSSIMAGVASGIRAAGAEVVSAIQQVAEETNAALKEYYQISSPSRLMRDEVGVMISRGIAEGILDGSSFVSGAMSSVYGNTAVSGVPAVSGQSGGKAVTQNIYLRNDTNSPYRTARRIRRESEAIFRL